MSLALGIIELGLLVWGMFLLWGTPWATTVLVWFFFNFCTACYVAGQKSRTHTRELAEKMFKDQSEKQESIFSTFFKNNKEDEDE